MNLNKSAISLGRILGIPIGVDYSWFLIFALLTWSLATSYFPAEFKDWPVTQYWIVGALTADLSPAFFLVRSRPATRTDDLGVTPPDDSDGVLQDVHWYAGVIGGAFQGYTLGNILNAQFYEAALRAHPEIPAQIEQGEFGALHGWLQDNIYQHGSKFTASELVERVTGGPMRIEPYIRYLRTKYGELYPL